MESFEKYKTLFEEAVAEGVYKGLLGSVKSVPVSPGKLSRRTIGTVLGEIIEVDTALVIDYYGYMKKSKGFNDLVGEVIESLSGRQVKMIEAPVVHFNAVRLEVLAKIAPDLVSGFGDFKKAVLDAREFNHNYKV
jgi:hypothetical protein